MKYKNIIFDFGNVIGKFKGDYILGKFASTPEDYDILADAIFKNWVALDAGTIDYDQNAEDTIAGLPDHLKDTAASGDMEIHQRIKSPRGSDLPAFQCLHPFCGTRTGRSSDPERIRRHRVLCSA